jgi:hypothetical protein
MSRKKKTVILGPDGKPYVAPPKETDQDPATQVRETRTIEFNHDITAYTLQRMAGLLGHEPKSGKPREKPLAKAVAEQVAALAADFEGETREELPKPAADLHTYTDALASARKNCKHPYPESTTYAKGEWYCGDCERYFGPDEYARTRNRGIFGYFS